MLKSPEIARKWPGHVSKKTAKPCMALNLKKNAQLLPNFFEYPTVAYVVTRLIVAQVLFNTTC